MRNFILLLFCLSTLKLGNVLASQPEDNGDTLLNTEVRTLNNNKTINLHSEYKNKVVLIVNTASKCGFTPQFDGLEKLYKTYKDKGFVVLGFPSNDFANQDPGTEKQIQSFCRLTYGVKFPMFTKTHVRKNNADPLYRKLGETAGEYPAWNFHKYLVNREGQLVASYSSSTEPLSKKLISKIEFLLK